MPETSVIIRTFNEAKHLPALLDALRRQRYRDFEIIVVDSGSLDRTLDIAREGADNVVSIDSKDFTFGYSLNVGIRAAHGRFLALVSAHTVPLGPNWLEALVAPLRDERNAMVYGRQLGDGRSKYSEIQDFRRTFGPRRQLLRPPNFFANNANSAVRRDLWEEYPFDEALPGLEDIGWAKYWMERGYDVVYEPDAALIHIHQESWPQVRRRYHREAIAAHWIGIKGYRHVVTEPVRELFWGLEDLARALFRALRGKRSSGLLRRIHEILMFRYNKTVGTIQGLIRGADVRDPAVRQEFYFDRNGRAVVIEDAGKVELRHRPVPEIKPGDVLIRVAYAGICATDLEILDGQLGYYKSGLASYPIVPGHEVSGVVVRKGVNIGAELVEGDRVVVECIQTCGYCADCRRGEFIACTARRELGVIGRDGGLAEHLVVPGVFVHRLPPEVDLMQGALCEPLAVVMKGVSRLEAAAVRPDALRNCAVVGLGPIGNLAAQVMALRGYAVTGFDRDAGRRAILAGMGIEAAEDLDRLSQFDVVIEATGNARALEHALRASRSGAMLLLLGLPYGPRDFSFEDIVAYDKTVIGSVGSSAADFRDAIAILPRLDTAPFLEQKVPFEEYRRAFALARDRGSLKVMLEVAGTAAEEMAAPVFESNQFVAIE